MDFDLHAPTLLEDLFEELDAAIGDTYEIDYENGILSLKGAEGEYILNKHAPTKQLWLSSPKSGACHFSLQEGVWSDTKEGKNLISMLELELNVTLTC